MLSNLPFGLLRCIERTVFYPPILNTHHDWECVSKRGQLLTVVHQILYFYLAIHRYPRARSYLFIMLQMRIPVKFLNQILNFGLIAVECDIKRAIFESVVIFTTHLADIL